MEFLHEANRIYMTDNGGKTIAEVLFPAENGDTVNITHTVVDVSLRGQGVAGKLLEAVVEQLILDHKKARLTCSYAIKWFGEHPEHADLVIKQN